MTTPLQSIRHGKAKKPPRILIYGCEGIGKSTWAASAPAPIFIPTEDGLDQIACDSFPLAHSFEEVLSNVNLLLREEHAYRTVALDSCDWLEQLIWEYLCRQYGAKSIEKVDGGYGKGYVHALTLWREVIDLLRQLRDQKSMIVILLAHASVENFTDPETAAYSRFTPRLHKKASGLLCDWCDAILLATRELSAAKGESGGKRVVRCNPSATGVAKNRYGMPDLLPFTWKAVMQAIKEGENDAPKQH